MKHKSYISENPLKDMEKIAIKKKEYVQLKKKAELNNELLIKLVNGLEDIKQGRIKLWKKSIV